MRWFCEGLSRKATPALTEQRVKQMAPMEWALVLEF